MRRLDASDWLANPNLDKVKAAPKYGDQANTFNLTVRFRLQPPTNSQEKDERWHLKIQCAPCASST